MPACRMPVLWFIFINSWFGMAVMIQQTVVITFIYILIKVPKGLIHCKTKSYHYLSSSLI